MAKNILVVDDAAFMRMMIKDILTKNGYNVVGEAERLRRLKRQTPEQWLLCARLWASRLWLSTQFKAEQRTSS